jgi:hypothetical protein
LRDLLLACPLFTSAHKALNTWDLLSWLIVVAFVREVHAAEAGWLRRFNIVAFALGHCLEGTRLLVYLVGAQELLVLLEDALVAAVCVHAGRGLVQVAGLAQVLRVTDLLRVVLLQNHR